MKAIQHVAGLLEEAIGLSPDALGASVLGSAVRSRMSAVRVASVEEYAGLLEPGPEREALIDEVVVPESWFFREPAAFELLEAHVRSRSARPARVLSAGCAGGEEAYSISLALLRSGMPPGSFEVHALDVSTRQLEIARRGLYGMRALRGAAMPEGFASIPGGRSFEVPRSLRREVRFFRGNLADPALQLPAEYDAIFCRNVLIYLHRAARRTCVATLVGALAPGGLLFAGNTEALPLVDPRLAPAGPPAAFAFERRHSGRIVHALAPAAKARATTRRSPAAAPAPFPRPPAATPTSAGDLLRARALADRGRLHEARALCETALAGGTDATGCYLLGEILLAEGDLAGAEESFLRTIALDERHAEALAHLQLFAEGRGNDVRAAGFRRRRMEALASAASTREPGAGATRATSARRARR